MDTNSKKIQDLKEIKDMMERSSRFLSLSGLSGISAGIIALIGAVIAYFIMDMGKIEYHPYFYLLQPLPFERILFPLLILGISVVILALGSALFFSWRKARKHDLSLWNHTTRRLLSHLFIPLITGVFFILILIDRNDETLVASATLIFYGLALVNAGKYTFGEIHYLGISEIILGILAGIFVHYGLIFWTIGFGVLHILYGFVMYYRYER
nr:hypothetical protein [Bacteroidota bacterium]